MDRLLSVEDVARYIAADDFLWTVRFHLHDLTGSKDERLTFDVQPELAERMGYEDGEEESAVERFMREYFRTAMHVGALTRLVCAKLEADAWEIPSDRYRAFPSGPSGLRQSGPRRIHCPRRPAGFRPVTDISDDPVRLLRYFHIASSNRLDLHPEAVARIGRTLHHVDDAFRSDPRAAREFFAVLLDAPAPMAVLRLMTESGLLGRYIPEFGDVVARNPVQHVSPLHGG